MLMIHKTVKSCGSSEFSFKEILEWCNNRQTVPVDEDEVFCVNIDYIIKKSKRVEHLDHLRIICSTKRLLSQALVKCKYTN